MFQTNVAETAEHGSTAIEATKDVKVRERKIAGDSIRSIATPMQQSTTEPIRKI